MPRDTEPSEEPDPISLERGPASGLGPCDHCKSTTNPLLGVHFETTWFTLCAGCEGELLSLLLRNYVRRAKRGKKVPALEKLAEGEDVWVELPDETSEEYWFSQHD